MSVSGLARQAYGEGENPVNFSKAGVTKIHDSFSDHVFSIVNYIIVTIVFIIVLYPCIYVISASVSNSADVTSGKMWLLPTSLNFDAYKMVFQNDMIWVGYRNTILYTLVGTFCSVFVTLFAAYALSRKDLVGRNALTFIFAFTMFFNGGMIPTYLVIKDLHMLNTPFAIIMPGMLSIWNLIITRTYIQTSIPPDILEAAKIDGCSDFKYFWRMVVPLSGSIIAVITLFYAVGLWNQYFNALLYITSKQLYPLSIVLREILIQNVNNEALNAADQAKLEQMRQLLKYALIVVASVPVLIIYPFIQKNFVKGVMIGSIKG